MIVIYLEPPTADRLDGVVGGVVSPCDASCAVANGDLTPKADIALTLT